MNGGRKSERRERAGSGRGARAMASRKAASAADERVCSDCGKPYVANGSDTSELIEVSVKAHTASSLAPNADCAASPRFFAAKRTERAPKGAPSRGRAGLRAFSAVRRSLAQRRGGGQAVRGHGPGVRSVQRLQETGQGLGGACDTRFLKCAPGFHQMLARPSVLGLIRSRALTPALSFAAARRPRPRERSLLSRSSTGRIPMENVTNPTARRARHVVRRPLALNGDVLRWLTAWLLQRRIIAERRDGRRDDRREELTWRCCAR